MAGLEGTQLGHYYLMKPLGHGGMSEVYLAYDADVDREIVVKVVTGNHADSIERFQREADAIDKLKHNHILPPFEYGVQEPWHYLAMPYIEHGTLRDRLDKGPLTLEEAGEILTQVASALQWHDIIGSCQVFWSIAATWSCQVRNGLRIHTRTLIEGMILHTVI